MESDIPNKNALKEFQHSWSHFNDWTSKQNTAEGKSSMWQDMIQDFDLHRNKNLPKDLKKFLFRTDAFRGYGFVLKNQKHQGLGIKGLLFHARYLLVRALNLLRTKLWLSNLSAGGRAELQGFPAGERELERRGMLKGYQDFCNQHDFLPHGFNAIKLYYIAARVKQEIHTSHNDFKKISIIEVGGGVGGLTSILFDIANIHQYLIVDLPEMILNSSMAIHALHPEMPLHYIYPDSDTVHDPEKPGVYFCVPEMVDKIQADSFNFGINIDSFQEMNESQVSGYLKLFQNVCKTEASFINLNRRKYLKPEKFDNNPLTYPYDPANQVRVWEVDSFMGRTLNLVGSRMDPWILRIETIAK